MESVLTFWFETIEPKDWYKGSNELDAEIKKRFDATHNKILAGETAHWRDTPEGRLAEIIVLDQFGRNMYRGTPKPFIYDALALALAQEAIRGGCDESLDPAKRSFLYMPYMHSESREIHLQAMELFKGLPGFDSEVRHKEIIDQFGRYPHRNEVLGRTSTDEEIVWMQSNAGF